MRITLYTNVRATRQVVERMRQVQDAIDMSCQPKAGENPPRIASPLLLRNISIHEACKVHESYAQLDEVVSGWYLTHYSKPRRTVTYMRPISIFGQVCTTTDDAFEAAGIVGVTAGFLDIDLEYAGLDMEMDKEVSPVGRFINRRVLGELNCYRGSSALRGVDVQQDEDFQDYNVTQIDEFVMRTYGVIRAGISTLVGVDYISFSHAFGMNASYLATAGDAAFDDMMDRIDRIGYYQMPLLSAIKGVEENTVLLHPTGTTANIIYSDGFRTTDIAGSGPVLIVQELTGLPKSLPGRHFEMAELAHYLYTRRDVQLINTLMVVERLWMPARTSLMDFTCHREKSVVVNTRPDLTYDALYFKTSEQTFYVAHSLAARIVGSLPGAEEPKVYAVASQVDIHDHVTYGHLTKIQSSLQEPIDSAGAILPQGERGMGNPRPLRLPGYMYYLQVNLDRPLSDTLAGGPADDVVVASNGITQAFIREE